MQKHRLTILILLAVLATVGTPAVVMAGGEAAGNSVWYAEEFPLWVTLVTALVLIVIMVAGGIALIWKRPQPQEGLDESEKAELIQLRQEKLELENSTREMMNTLSQQSVAIGQLVQNVNFLKAELRKRTNHAEIAQIFEHLKINAALALEERQKQIAEGLRKAEQEGNAVLAKALGTQLSIIEPSPDASGLDHPGGQRLRG